MKRGFYTLIAIVLLAVGGHFIVHNYHSWQQKVQPVNINGTALRKPKNIAPFVLNDSNSNSFDDSKLLNHWSILFFGYTRCPDICPTTLNTLNEMYKLMADLPTKKKPHVIFISFDSEHDNSKQVAQYSKYFNNNFIGLTGNDTQIANLTKSLGVVYQPVKAEDQDDDSFLFDHSNTLFVINPKGQLQAIFTSPHNAKNLAQDYKLILNKYY